MYWSLATNTTPEVPRDTKPSPLQPTPMPMPIALAALSPAPPAIGTSTGMPQRCDHSGNNVPDRALPSTSRGMCARVRPQTANMRSDQSRCAISSHSVPAASDISLTASPHSFKRSQSLGNKTQCTCSKIAGSCARTHSILGAVNPGMARLPAMALNSGKAAVSSTHCTWLRPSFQRMAGRRTA